MKAFPHDPTHDADSGMDLRDYFAAKAMQGLTSDSKTMSTIAEKLHQDGFLTEENTSEHDAIFAAGVAKACFGMADAMLEARAIKETE